MILDLEEHISCVYTHWFPELSPILVVVDELLQQTAHLHQLVLLDVHTCKANLYREQTDIGKTGNMDFKDPDISRLSVTVETLHYSGVIYYRFTIHVCAQQKVTVSIYHIFTHIEICTYK